MYRTIVHRTGLNVDCHATLEFGCHLPCPAQFWESSPSKIRYKSLILVLLLVFFPGAILNQVRPMTVGGFKIGKQRVLGVSKWDERFSRFEANRWGNPHCNSFLLIQTTKSGFRRAISPLWIHGNSKTRGTSSKRIECKSLKRSTGLNFGLRCRCIQTVWWRQRRVRILR